MRHWHRRLGFLIGALMFFIAATGLLLQAEMMWSDGTPGGGPGPGRGASRAGGGGRAGAPPEGAQALAGAPAALSDEDVKVLFSQGLAAVRRLSPEATLMGLELRPAGARPTVTVVLADPQMRRLTLDARTGEPLDASAARGGRDLHGILLDLHRGAVAGSPGQWVSLVAGLVLCVLSVTGLVIYGQTWWRRRKAGQHGLWW